MGPWRLPRDPGHARRNTILALDVHAEATETGSLALLPNAHRQWVEAALNSELRQRDKIWAQSLAVGSTEFVLNTKMILGARGQGRGTVMAGDSFSLREPPEIHGAKISPQNRAITPDNGFMWNDYF